MQKTSTKKIELGINNSFLIKKWVEPEDWIKLIVEDIGISNIQHCLDLFGVSLNRKEALNSCNTIREIAKKYNSKISSTFTGLFTYYQNMLGHPNISFRQEAVLYYENAIRITSLLGASSTGGYFFSFTDKDINSIDMKNDMIDFYCKSIINLSKFAKKYKLEYLTIEYMPSPYEPPHKISEAEELLNSINNFSEVPIYLTLDLGHTVSYDLDINGKDTDVYYVVEKLLPITKIIHLQQTDGKGDRHWPFTPEFNKIGIINPKRIIDLINKYSKHQIELIFEILPSCEQSVSKIISDQKESVEYWFKYLEQ